MLKIENIRNQSDVSQNYIKCAVFLPILYEISRKGAFLLGELLGEHHKIETINA